MLVHLIRRSKEKDFLSQLKDALRQVKGGFSFLVQTQTELYGAVDPFEFRPLILGKNKKWSIYFWRVKLVRWKLLERNLLEILDLEKL